MLLWLLFLLQTQAGEGRNTDTNEEEDETIAEVNLPCLRRPFTCNSSSLSSIFIVPLVTLELIQYNRYVV